MERVYLLLRNNQQTGPFTIGELLQQQLRSSDMIWIEGKSTAWTYLSELELTPFAKESETVKKETLSRAEDEIEKKAEELRQRILASAPRTYFPQHTTQIESFASPYKLEDEIEFVDVRKQRRIRKNSVLGELVLTCFVIGLFMLGIYKGKSFLGARQNVPSEVATELNSHDQHAAQKNKVVAQPVAVPVDTAQQIDSLLAVQKAKPKTASIKRQMLDSTMANLSQPIINSNKPVETNTVETPTNPSEDSAVKKTLLPKKENDTAVSDVKHATEPAKEEKKGFLKGLFKKRNRSNDKSE